jgi:hypothetical protein
MVARTTAHRDEIAALGVSLFGAAQRIDAERIPKSGGAC